MKVTLLQTDIRWLQPQSNIDAADRLIAGNAGSDLYVLPEMWSTGFVTDPRGVALPEAGNEALRWMQQTALQHRCAISGSLAVVDADGRYRNRHYLADGRAGKLYYYDKHHLFTFGHEDRYYTPGTSHQVVSYGGMTLLLLTCYDLRFPVWCRNTRQQRFDAIVLVANWPQARQAAWQLLPRARAIENQCYVVAVNRVGDDQFGHYIGCSAVIDPIGRTIAQGHRDRHEAITVTLEKAELERRRARFDVLSDSDSFTLF